MVTGENPVRLAYWAMKHSTRPPVYGQSKGAAQLNRLWKTARSPRPPFTWCLLGFSTASERARDELLRAPRPARWPVRGLPRGFLHVRVVRLRRAQGGGRHACVHRDPAGVPCVRPESEDGGMTITWTEGDGPTEKITAERDYGQWWAQSSQVDYCGDPEIGRAHV